MQYIPGEKKLVKNHQFCQLGGGNYSDKLDSLVLPEIVVNLNISPSRRRIG